jgi:hypothetical protein
LNGRKEKAPTEADLEDKVGGKEKAGTEKKRGVWGKQRSEWGRKDSVQNIGPLKNFFFIGRINREETNRS